MVLGDSLSAAHNIPAQRGWVALLQERLAAEQPGTRVVNASISGETSAGGLARIDELLAAHEPSLLLLELGANDGLRGLPLSALRSNLDSMIVAAKGQGVQVALLGIVLPVNYGRRYRDGMRAVYKELAATHELALVPFLLEGVAQDPAKMQPDGLHPTAEAQPQILDNVWPVIDAYFSRVAAEM